MSNGAIGWQDLVLWSNESARQHFDAKWNVVCYHMYWDRVAIASQLGLPPRNRGLDPTVDADAPDRM